jgi:hypothetical protein
MRRIVFLLLLLHSAIYAFFDTSHPQFDCVEMEAKAERLFAKASLKHNGDPTFFSLSPSLLNAIGKAFVYQMEVHPDLLQQGAYYEFGLYRGASIWFAEQVGRGNVPDDFLYYGIDSFEGLPSQSTDFDAAWRPGVYACSLEQVQRYLRENHADMDKITLIKGWYSKSLFDAFVQQYAPKPPAIMVIDSDLYESCAEILNFFGPSIPDGCIILFDDFNADGKNDNRSERRALKEYMQAHPDFQIRHLLSFGWHGEAFEVALIGRQHPSQ